MFSVDPNSIRRIIPGIRRAITEISDYVSNLSVDFDNVLHLAGGFMLFYYW